MHADIYMREHISFIISEEEDFCLKDSRNDIIIVHNWSNGSCLYY